MKSGGANAPVIIKRKKVISGGGHHGGAWKVAYADFVTAMMAFFMLMWLLNATTEKQRKGIADYFSPTIAVNRVSGGGDGSLGGNSVMTENTLPRRGTGATSLYPTSQDKARGAVNADTQAGDDIALRAAEESMFGSGGESMLDRNAMQHVEIRMTDEGLIIELFDRPGAPLFTGSETATPLLQALMRAVTRSAIAVGAPIAIGAHVASVPVVRAVNPVWDHSAQRASVARQALTGNGVAPERIVRSTAHADSEPVSQNRLSERNNRIEIVFLRE